MRKVLLVLATTVALGAHAQFTESFNDGEFTTNPVWSGTPNSWIITNSDASTLNGTANPSTNTLRLDAPGGASGTTYLSTQVLGSWDASQIWGFWIGRRSQAATTANPSYFWLYANEANVSSGTVDGYRIRFGDDSGGDELVLERITDGAVAATVITSTTAVTNGITDYGFLVRVTRNAAGRWTLFTSTLPTASGSGAIATDFPNATNASVFQGSAVDLTYSTFTDGYVAVAQLHTNGANPRSAVEFDQIVLSFSSNAALPIRMDGFRATQAGNRVNLSFANLSEQDLTGYTIERSADGQSFTSIGSVEPARNNGGRADYQFTDASPLAGSNFYRIRATERGGKNAFTSIAKLTIGGAAGFNLYPNPLKGSQLGLQLTNLPQGEYAIRVYNASGQVVHTRLLNHRGGSATETLVLANLQKGVYSLELAGAVRLQKQLLVE